MPIIEAQNSLLDVRTSSFPHFKKPTRTKVIQDLKRQANSMIKKAGSGKLMTYEQVMNMLSLRK